jgi:hypothetical protein
MRQVCDDHATTGDISIRGGCQRGRAGHPLNSKGHCAARTNRANILLTVKVVMGAGKQRGKQIGAG